MRNLLLIEFLGLLAETYLESPRTAHGRVWIDDGDLGTFSYGARGCGSTDSVVPDETRGHGAKTLLPDQVAGGVWLAFYEGGVVYFGNGQVRGSYTAANGLGSRRVNDLRFGSEGTLWAATEGGLSRIRAGRVATITSKNGLPCEKVHWSVEDDEHFV